MPQVISANRLIDGIVVYAGRDGAWADALGAAKIFTSKAEAEAALLLAQNDVKRNLVVDPCLVEVTEEARGVRAVTLRESIRARGPTIDFLPQTRAFAYEVALLPDHRATQETQAVLRNQRSEAARESVG
jgi:sulfite reductase (NADPH) hemoprotein beta-component